MSKQERKKRMCMSLDKSDKSIDTQEKIESTNQEKPQTN